MLCATTTLAMTGAIPLVDYVVTVQAPNSFWPPYPKMGGNQAGWVWQLHIYAKKVFIGTTRNGRSLGASMTNSFFIMPLHCLPCNQYHLLPLSTSCSATLGFFSSFQLVEQLSVNRGTFTFLCLDSHSHAPATSEKLQKCRK